MNVFISGSISINKLPPLALEKINSIIANNYTILIGDANSVDSLVQKYLLMKNYNNVIVYFVGENARNNAGNWESNKIIPDKDLKKGRELYTVKDKAMAKNADYGLMIWDGVSKGTRNNINEMKNQNKRFYVILNGEIVSDKNFIMETKHITKNTELQPALL